MHHTIPQLQPNNSTQPTTLIQKKKETYKVPVTEHTNTIPDLLCNSMVDGGIDDLTEEEWTL
ncbi:MAG: hypothetical protein IJU68_02215 [Bacteroidales bacterium]|nr:hypothetical protein [Bacteroidales bacterium]